MRPLSLKKVQTSRPATRSRKQQVFSTERTSIDHSRLFDQPDSTTGAVDVDPTTLVAAELKWLAKLDCEVHSNDSLNSIQFSSVELESWEARIRTLMGNQFDEDGDLSVRLATHSALLERLTSMFARQVLERGSLSGENPIPFLPQNRAGFVMPQCVSRQPWIESAVMPSPLIPFDEAGIQAMNQPLPSLMQTLLKLQTGSEAVHRYVQDIALAIHRVQVPFAQSLLSELLQPLTDDYVRNKLMMLSSSDPVYQQYCLDFMIVRHAYLLDRNRQDINQQLQLTISMFSAMLGEPKWQGELRSDAQLVALLRPSYNRPIFTFPSIHLEPNRKSSRVTAIASDDENQHPQSIDDFAEDDVDTKPAMTDATQESAATNSTIIFEVSKPLQPAVHQQLNLTFPRVDSNVSRHTESADSIDQQEWMPSNVLSSLQKPGAPTLVTTELRVACRSSAALHHLLSLHELRSQPQQPPPHPLHQQQLPGQPQQFLQQQSQPSQPPQQTQQQQQQPQTATQSRSQPSKRSAFHFDPLSTALPYTVDLFKSALPGNLPPILNPDSKRTPTISDPLHLHFLRNAALDSWTRTNQSTFDLLVDRLMRWLRCRAQDLILLLACCRAWKQRSSSQANQCRQLMLSLCALFHQQQRAAIAARVSSELAASMQHHDQSMSPASIQPSSAEPAEPMLDDDVDIGGPDQPSVQQPDEDLEPPPAKRVRFDQPENPIVDDDDTIADDEFKSLLESEFDDLFGDDLTQIADDDSSEDPSIDELFARLEAKQQSSASGVSTAATSTTTTATTNTSAETAAKVELDSDLESDDDEDGDLQMSQSLRLSALLRSMQSHRSISFLTAIQHLVVSWSWCQRHVQFAARLAQRLQQWLRFVTTIQRSHCYALLESCSDDPAMISEFVQLWNLDTSRQHFFDPFTAADPTGAAADDIDADRNSTTSAQLRRFISQLASPSQSLHTLSLGALRHSFASASPDSPQLIWARLNQPLPRSTAFSVLSTAPHLLPLSPAETTWISIMGQLSSSALSQRPTASNRRMTTISLSVLFPLQSASSLVNSITSTPGSSSNSVISIPSLFRTLSLPSVYSERATTHHTTFSRLRFFHCAFSNQTIFPLYSPLRASRLLWNPRLPWFRADITPPQGAIVQNQKYPVVVFHPTQHDFIALSSRLVSSAEGDDDANPDDPSEESNHQFIAPAPLRSWSPQSLYQAPNFLPDASNQLSAVEGHIVLLEHMERSPLLHAEVGMCSHIVYACTQVNSSTALEEIAEGTLCTMSQRDPTPLLASIDSLVSHTASTSTPGLLPLHITSLYTALIAQHRLPSSEYFLLTRHIRRSEFDAFFLRPIPSMFTVGQHHPHYSLPQPTTSTHTLDQSIADLWRECIESACRVLIQQQLAAGAANIALTIAEIRQALDITRQCFCFSFPPHSHSCALCLSLSLSQTQMMRPLLNLWCDSSRTHYSGIDSFLINPLVATDCIRLKGQIHSLLNRTNSSNRFNRR